MIRDLWRLVKHTMVYGFGNAILMPIGLFTLPILTRVFAPADYGVMELIGTITSLMSLFLMLGMTSAVQRSYFDSPDPEQRRTVVSSAFWFLLPWSMLLVMIAFFSSTWLSSLVLQSNEHVTLLRIALITLSFSLIISFSQNTLRLHFSPWKFTVISIASGVLTVSFSLLFVLLFKLGLAGYFGGCLLGTALVLIPALYFIRQDLKLSISGPKLKGMLLYGAPLVPAALASYILELSNRFFLAKFTTLSDIGLYSIASKISTLMFFFNTALGLAWSPFVFKMMSESEERVQYVISRVMKYILVFFSLLAVSLTTFSPEILRLLTTPQYFNAAAAVAPLSLAVVAHASTQVTALGISFSRKTKYIALSSWIAAMTNLGLNALLIPRWGILGAASASTVSAIVLTLGYYIMSQRLYPIKLDKVAILKIGLACIAFTIGGRFVNVDSLILGIGIKIGFVLSFIGVLFVSRVFDASELAYFKGWLSGFRKVRSVSDLHGFVRSQMGEKN